MIKLAWRNIWRNSRRTLITMASVFSAVLFCIICESLALGSWNKLIDNILRTQASHIEVQGKGYDENRNMDYYMSMDTATLRRLRELPHVTNISPRVEAFALGSSDKTAKGVGVLGIDPAEEHRKSSLADRLVEGEYLRQDDDGVLLGRRLSEFLQVEVGDSVALMGQGYHGSSAIGLFPVRGIVSLIFPELDNNLMYMSIPAAQYFINMPDGYSGLLVSVDKQRHIDETRRQIASLTDTAHVATLPWEQTMEELLIQSKANDVYRQIIKFILYVIVGFGILGTIIMMTNERKHEFGVLVALGMKRRRLSAVVCVEMAFITLIGAASAILVSLPVTYYFELFPIRIGGELGRISMGYGMEPVLPMMTTPHIFLNQAAIVLLITCVIIFYPVYKISKLKIDKAIRQ